MAPSVHRVPFCLLAAFGVMLVSASPEAAAEEISDFLARQTRPITLNVSDESVGTVLKMISRAGDFDIVLSPELVSKVTVRFQSVPVGVALARVLELGGIEAGVSDGVLLAYPREGLRTFRLQHVPVQRVLDLVKPFLSGAGKAGADAKTNTLIVQDTSQALNQVQRLVAQLDRRPRQVNVEAAIVSTKLNNVTNLGVNFRKISVIGDNRLQSRTSGLAKTEAANIDPLLTPQGLFLSYLRSEGGITAVLEALQQNTDFKILSHPRLQALSGEPAEIKVGDELGFLTSTVSVGAAGGAPTTTQQVQFLNVGTILRFTAQISDDGMVDLLLSPEVSNGSIDANGLPAKNTSQLSTRVRIKSGQTLLLGGLIRTRDEETVNQVPLLGSIPLLGALFRSKATTKASDEVVVMITPTVETDPEEREKEDAKEATREGVESVVPVAEGVHPRP